MLIHFSLIAAAIAYCFGAYGYVSIGQYRLAITFFLYAVVNIIFSTIQGVK